MTTLRALFVLVLAFSFSVSACDSKKASDESSDKKKGESEKKVEEESSNTETITLADLDNLKVDVSKGTEPNKMGGSLMIMSMDESFTVGLAGEYDAKTLEDAKKDAAETYTGQNIAEETLSDGWAVTFDNKGSMGDTFFAWVRRDIGGKTYFCQTSVGFASLRDGALKACKTLRQ